jgi:hypothetical protein
VACELTNQAANYSAYRQALRDSLPPAIPNVSLVLKDLTFIHDGNPDRLRDNPFLVNFSKLRMMGRVVEENVHRLQSVPYCLHPVPELRQLLAGIEVLTEEEAFEESLVAEDRQGRTPLMRGEMVEAESSGGSKDYILLHDVNLTQEELLRAEQEHRNRHAPPTRPR